MKKVLLFLIAPIALVRSLSAQDLPNPSSNLQTLPANSYVIAMDNMLQTNDDPTASKRLFNLKAYGLVTYLLNNNVKVKRVIKSGKAKDAVDFSASAQMVKPSTGTTSVLDFKAGPFVIFASDLAGVAQLVENFNNNVGGVSGITDPDFKVKVYQTKAATNVDVRYDLTGFKPKGAVLDDGGDPKIQTSYFEAGGVPVANYEIVANTGSLITNCYTFASEPHNDKPDMQDADNVRQFAMAGGNFLAECKAIQTYETNGHFQSTSGAITIQNDNVDVPQFPNADLSYSQFEGGFKLNQGGAITDFSFNSNIASNAYLAVHGANDKNVNVVTASVVKLLPANKKGGLIFYLGNHKYGKPDNYDDINGMRLYLNAFLTPAENKGYMTVPEPKRNGDGTSITVSVTAGPANGYPVTFKLYDASNQTTPLATTQITTAGTAGSKNLQISAADAKKTLVLTITPSVGCPDTKELAPQSPLPVTLLSFDAKRSKATVNLNWKSATEQNCEGYIVQRQTGGDTWQTIAFVPSKATGGNSTALLNYSYADLNAVKGITNYRIQQVDYSGNGRYSEIRPVIGDGDQSKVLVYPNPSVNGKFNLLFSNVDPKDVSVFDMTGRMVKEYKSITSANLTVENLVKGVYSIRVNEKQTGTISVEKVVVE